MFTTSDQTNASANGHDFVANPTPTRLSVLINETEHQLAILDLTTRLLSLQNTRAVRAQAAHLIAEYLGADYVAIGENRVRSTPCPLAVVEGPNRPPEDWRADVESSLGECALTARAHSVQADSKEGNACKSDRQRDELPTGMSIQSLHHRHLATVSLIAIPLLTSDQRSAGAILVALRAPSSDVHSFQSAFQFLQQLALPLAELLLTFERAEPSELVKKYRAISRAFDIDHRRRTIAICALVFAIGLIPYRFPVSAEVSVQPNVRRWIVAPFDAPLKKVHVSPGQAVKVGQLLFTIDCEDTLSRLASVRAESEKSATERSAHLSAARLSDAAIAGWNMKRLASEIEQLSKHLDRADIRSPIDGVVLGDDLGRLEGTPLKAGQPLVEIARIDEMHLDLEIPTSQILRVTVASEVSARIEAAGSMGELTLTSIHPRAEPNEQGVYVFKARAEVPKDSTDIKPGMRGVATVHGEYRPLALCLWESLWQRLSRWS